MKHNFENTINIIDNLRKAISDYSENSDKFNYSDMFDNIYVAYKELSNIIHKDYDSFVEASYVIEAIKNSKTTQHESNTNNNNSSIRNIRDNSIQKPKKG